MEKEKKLVLVEKVENLLDVVIEPMGLELVDIEYLQDGAYYYLRIYLERRDGEITLDECAKVSNAISEKVDALISDKFFLEVSSPGLERPLKKKEDFVRFTGKTIKVLLKQKVNDLRNITGKLTSFDGEQLVLDVDGEMVEILFTNIKKSNIVFDFANL